MYHITLSYTHKLRLTLFPSITRISDLTHRPSSSFLHPLPLSLSITHENSFRFIRRSVLWVDSWKIICHLSLISNSFERGRRRRRRWRCLGDCLFYLFCLRAKVSFHVQCHIFWANIVWSIWVAPKLCIHQSIKSAKYLNKMLIWCVMKREHIARHLFWFDP